MDYYSWGSVLTLSLTKDETQLTDGWQATLRSDASNIRDQSKVELKNKKAERRMHGDINEEGCYEVHQEVKV